ncbi:MAG: hypothetical protein C5B43_01785 [Verrucomicrobia bacterium]|nr:MAG: hypothetical protein C5B43_01785 [Verrucomicrobiota bacterium]
MALGGVGLRVYGVSLIYGITVCTEAEELKRLLKQIKENLDDPDKIIVQVDSSNTNQEVSKVVKRFKKELSSSQFYVVEKSLDGDFGKFKNNVLSVARKKGGDFVFLLDADEYLSSALMMNLKWYLSINSDVECMLLARANYYVDLDYYPEFKKENEGGLDDMGRFLYMDQKLRIVNLKNSRIKYKGKIHEEIEGCTEKKLLPVAKGNCWEIIHIKTPKKQMEQNELYKELMK